MFWTISPYCIRVDGTILLYLVIDLFYYVLQYFCFVLVWCLCVAINVISVHNSGGFLTDIKLLTQCYYHRGTRLNAMKRFCIPSL